MEYYGGRYCVSVNDLVGNGLIPYHTYENWTKRGKIDVARPAHGKGNYVLIVYDSLPAQVKDSLRKIHPNEKQHHLCAWVMSNYEEDNSAVVYFHSRKQAGVELPSEKIREYVVNASVLNTCIKLYNRAATAQKMFGGSYNWEEMAAAITALKVQLGHTLPASTLRFRKKVNEYKRDGYKCLISGKFGNQSARRVSIKVERLLLSIAIQENQPYAKQVWELYMKFVTSEYDVWSYATGELYNPDDFVDKSGEPLSLSESTIANVLNNPKNKMLIEKALRSWSAFMHEQLPHMHRHAGEWSLSQITMDDVDLKRRMSGNKRVHVYRAWDVVSQCIIGVSYAREKNVGLVVECFRDMFRLIDNHGWGVPAGIEVENHLMTQYKDGFLKAGEVFNFVHFCAPQNSQEKYSEPLNSAFQNFLHGRHEGQGRFYLKGKNRIDQKKVSDETNELYEDKKYYDWDQLVADDRLDCYEWNHQLHPNQKKYPGMTRWDVLTECVNPGLKPLDYVTLVRYIGERVKTSVRRNSTVRVAYEDWWLSDPSVLEKLEPNNYEVTAYYMPDENGAPTYVYIYQGDKYIDQVEKVETYNRVMAEQTEEDVAKYIEQQKKIAKFSKYVRDNAIEQVGVMRKEVVTGAQQTEPEELEVPVAANPQQTELPIPAFARTEDRAFENL